MQVPSAVLEKLVCERCGGYLSRGPVHLLQNRKYRCGRCPWIENKDDEEGIRVEAYEELAQLMTFPCRYKENGCTTQVPFQDNKQHEEACPYRQYLCPIAEPRQCDWSGLQKEVLGHCQQDHPAKVLLENGCTFTYDITRPSLSNYVLFVFNVLFLIQCKVCMVSRKIYHAVRLLDDPARASDFKFILEIKNKHGKLTKYGKVAPRELLVLQEDTSVVTGINSLLEMLGDFKDTTFTVTIESSGQGTSRSSTPPVKTLEVEVRCSKCGIYSEPVYRGDWLCWLDGRKEFECKNWTRDCPYSDVKVKCEKHQLYHCEYNKLSISCSICSENINRGYRDAHYIQAHGDIVHRAGTVCTVNLVTNKKWLIINCDFGRALCSYELFGLDFVLSVYTSLPSAELYKYRCTVELSYPETGHTLRRTPTVYYSSQEDWLVRIPRSDYTACLHNNKVNIKINITKINDPSQFIL